MHGVCVSTLRTVIVCEVVGAHMQCMHMYTTLQFALDRKLQWRILL